MHETYILAIDQGTSASKCLLIGKDGHIKEKASAPLGETYPQPGWVEQDPEAIWNSISLATQACLKNRDPAHIEAVALSTQRESMLLWERASGKPVSNLVSWQDRRSTQECEKLRQAGHANLVKQRSGLPLDPMFSALKAKWLLDRHDPDHTRANKGELCLGTVDSFLLSRFAGNDHLTEAGNASRTQLLNVHDRAWDKDLLNLFNIPPAVLPRIANSNGPFPALRGVHGLRDGTPVMAALGDSHAALFGHGAFKPGKVKATYGTGSSVMGLLSSPENLHPGICLTIGWDLDRPALAAEANIRSSGATLRWLANLLALEPGEVAELAREYAAGGGEGAVVIPGFGGLGAPWWDNQASGMITGLSLASSRGALALGALESIPQQITDIVEILRAGGLEVNQLCVDGGPTRNEFLMQLQADLAGVEVACALDAELSALGAAQLAGVGAGWWSLADLAGMERPRKLYRPQMSLTKREQMRKRWRDALNRARSRSEGFGEGEEKFSHPRDPA